MEIIGAVERSEMPSKTNIAKGTWTGIAARAVHEQEHGRVLVLKIANDAEMRKLRNGVAQWLHDRYWRLDPVIVKEADGLKVYMQLEPTGLQEEVQDEPQSLARRARR